MSSNEGSKMKPFFAQFPYKLTSSRTWACILFSFSFAIAYLVAGPSALAELQKRCHPFPHPQQGGYCIHTETESKNKDLLYYLHGLGGNEHYWNDDFYYTAQIQAEWKNKNWDPPTVVSVSFGSAWLLVSRNSSPFSGLYERFVNQLLPQIESELGGLQGQRMILGESMGGFNTTQLALKSRLFKRAAILCAPMAPISPFATEDEMLDYAKTTQAWRYYSGQSSNPIPDSLKKASQISRAFCPFPGDWAVADPLQLAKLSRSENAPELYISMGAYDRFAAYESNEAFVATLKSRGLSVLWRPLWGGHCAVDIVSLAEFLMGQKTQ